MPTADPVLSIIIVNYNVRHFLEQCLRSIEKAMMHVPTEVMVVDNNSVDQSARMVQDLFPWVHWIGNQENLGFSKANNQGIERARGRYVLLLNPDTVVQENSLKVMVEFLDKEPGAGACGVHMVDSKGRFQPESKRGLPTPWAAFCKVFGLAWLFPKSRWFGSYHLKYLDAEKRHSVDVLSGACMCVRKDLLQKIGGLDEQFFMYGEDIDLSFRIKKAGYLNYYLPDTRIIHYKGESTKKGSLNYVMVFYKAMVLFTRKHYSASRARLLTFLLYMAIWLRAGLSIIKRMGAAIWKPLIDAMVLLGGMYILKEYWELNHRYVYHQYPPEFMNLIVPGYIAFWLGGMFLAGGYDKGATLGKMYRGLFMGSVVLMMVYAMLPESLRYSRALVVLGSLWALVALPSLRILYYSIRNRNWTTEPHAKKQYVIVGQQAEAKRVRSFLEKLQGSEGFLGLVLPGASEQDLMAEDVLGDLEKLPEIVRVLGVNEIVFCSKGLDPVQMIAGMNRLHRPDIEFKLVPEESAFMIGSRSAGEASDLYTLDLHLALAQPWTLRRKRLLDVLLCPVIAIIFIFMFWRLKKPMALPKMIVRVLLGKATWVGYRPECTTHDLPALPRGVIWSLRNQSHIDSRLCQKLNLLYARHYSVWEDLRLCLRFFKYLGGPEHEVSSEK